MAVVLALVTMGPIEQAFFAGLVTGGLLIGSGFTLAWALFR